MKKRLVAEFEFKGYLKTKTRCYYTFSNDLFSANLFFVICEDHPEKINKIELDERVSISVKQIDRIENRWVLKGVKWKS